jgi:hypothetical protein
MKRTHIVAGSVFAVALFVVSGLAQLEPTNEEFTR